MMPRMVLAILLYASFAMPAVARSAARSQAATPASYSNSSNDLQRLVWDMLAAQKSGGMRAVEPYLQILALPNASEWFTATFGNGNGQLLAIFYDAWTAPRNSQIAGDLARAQAMQMTDVAALGFEHPGDPGASDKDNYFLGLVKQPQTFYVVKFQSPDGATMRWAYFVYAAGAFRYLGPLAEVRLAGVSSTVSQPESTPEMPKRVRITEEMAEAHIAHRVLPVYPPQALAQRLEGSVVLHTTIAPDGSVESAEPTSGDPVLAQAAAAAVRQWRFDRMLVNGTPAAVDTTITVEFHLPSQPTGRQPGSSTAYAPIPSFPDSPGGLTKMMKEMMQIAQHGKLQDLQPYIHALVLPNADSWFPAQFGDKQGLRFAQSYEQVEQYLSAYFTQALQTETGLKYNSVQVQRFRDACTSEASAFEYPVLMAREQQSTPLYEVRFVKDTSYRSLFPFAYVDGGFRYLGNLTITQPDNRVFGQNIQWPKLIHEVPPVYPMGFDRPQNSGLVKLWGTIGADGSVSNLHVIEGTCPYVKATMDAVKKWRFTPLMVDGKPQETTYPFQYSYGPSQ
jgi:TonB family protein